MRLLLVCSAILLFRSAFPQDTWYKKPFPSDRDIYSIYFYNQYKGWTAGAGGLIAHTSDAGETWRIQYPYVGNDYNAICNLDSFPSDYWIAGNGGVVFRTYNKGEFWLNVSLNTDYHVYDVKFLNRLSGLVVGENGLIRRTTDAGTTWKPCVSGLNFSDLFSIAHTGSQYVVCGEDGFILKSTNEGANWSVVNSGTTRHLFALSYQSSSGKLWASGDSGIVLISQTNGNSWGVIQTGFTGALRDIYFLSAERGFAVGDSGVILNTTNGGVSWERLNSGTQNILSSISFYSQMYGFICGKGGTLLITSDGGNSWNADYTGSNADLNNLVIVKSPFKAFVVGKNRTFMSKNQINPPDNKWNNLSLHGDEKLNSIRFYNDSLGVAVGDRSLILKTTDGGKKWNKMAAPEYVHIISVAILEKNKYIISGYSMYYATKYICSTNDGAVTWHIDTTYTNSLFSLREIYYAPPSVLYVKSTYKNIFVS